MSYDGDVTAYEAPVKPEVFSVEALRDWLLTRDPAEEYDYQDAPNCLLGRWTGKTVSTLGVGLGISVATDGIWQLQTNGQSPFARIAITRPWTMQGALARCNAYLGERG